MNHLPRKFKDSITALPWAPVCHSLHSYLEDLAHFCLQEHCGIPEVPSGSKLSIQSPPLDAPAASIDRNWLGTSWPEYKGEATHTIPEECERLFCDKLLMTFLGEGTDLRQESLGVDALQNMQLNHAEAKNHRVRRWIEVWDYTSDAIFRGFVADINGEQTLFVFLEDGVLGHGLKSGSVFPSQLTLSRLQGLFSLSIALD